MSLTPSINLTPDALEQIMEELIEDVALAEAIREGNGSGNVSREEVFALLQGTA